MVSYQAWVSTVFETAKDGGAQFESIDDGGKVIDVAATVWNDRKAELKTATRSEARDIARQEISVS